MAEHSSGAFRTSIGGQALIEGILMRGPEKQAIVVRDKDGQLVEKVEELKLIKDRYPILGIPLIRGTVNFLAAMVSGVKALMYSADFYPEEEESQPSKFEQWLEKHLSSEKLEKALLVSPVVDMETLILSMMQGAHVTEEQLKAAGEIPTEMGETLSWPYLCWVREHPLQWHTPTQVLYGDKDALTSRAVMERFRRQSGAHLTILQGGEHWFHTEVQLAVLQSWEEHQC